MKKNRMFFRTGLFELPTMNSRITTASMSVKEKTLGYLLGPFGMLAFVSITNQLMELYYTEIFYIDQIFGVGTYLVMSWIIRVVGMVSGLLIAYVVERSVSVQGKFRPLILIGSLTAAVSGFLMFWMPEGMPDVWKLAWVCLFNMLYNCVGLSLFYLRSNLFVLATRNQNDRNQINMLNNIAGYLLVGTAVTLVVGSVLYYTMLHGHPARNWYVLIGLAAIVSIPLSIIQYFYTLERITCEKSKEERIAELSDAGQGKERQNVWQQIKALFHSKYGRNNTMKYWRIALLIGLTVISTAALAACGKKEPLCYHNELDANHKCLECGETLENHIFRNGVCIAPGCEATTAYEFESIPKEYLSPCPQKGRVEKLEYTTRAYSAERYYQDIKNRSPEELLSHKECYVYLPYGYDENRQYNVLYLFHGSGGKAKDWLNNEVTTLLDNLIYKGDCEPFIVVSPTFYYADVIDSKLLQESRYDQNCYFYELREVLIPTVESKYATYAERDENGTVTPESIIASRDHRAMAGCSRGSRTTVASGLMKSLDYISYFGCFEGITDAGTAILKSINSQEFVQYDVNFMYNGQGTEDFTREQHMENYDELLAYGGDRLQEGKNMCMVDKYFLDHSGASFNLDLYNFAKVDMFRHHAD